MMAILAAATGWAQAGYGVIIDGVEITSDNYQNITSDNGFFAVTSGEGSVAYDPYSNTLTLNGAMIDPTSDVGLELPAGVNVVLQGSNNIGVTPIGTGEPKVIAVNGNCTISGSGSLNCSIFGGNGIYIATNSTLTIKDCFVNVSASGDAEYDNGMGYGIRSAENVTAGALVVDYAKVVASGTNGGIRYISSLTLKGCGITSPTGASFDNSYWWGVSDSNGIVSQVTIDIIDEPYAVLDNQGTFTFYYDKQKNKRGGTVFDVKPNAESQDWKYNDFITIVDFDESFASYSGMTSLQSFFYDLENLTEIRNLSRLVTTGVTNMEAMFYYCTSLEELDLSGFNTANVTNMNFMFYLCGSLKTIVIGSGWNTENLVSDGGNFMFQDCTSLVGSQGTAYASNPVLDVSYAHIDGGESNPGYFTGVPEPYALLNARSLLFDYKLTFYYDDQKEYRRIETIEYQGEQIESETTFFNINDKEWTVLRTGDGIIIDYCDVIHEAAVDVSFANYHGLTDLSGFFRNLASLPSIEGLQYLNTENVTDMSGMFEDCTNLNALDVRHFDTSNVTDMSRMFASCESLSTILCNDDWQRNDLVSDEMFVGCNHLENYADDAANDASFANPITGYFTGSIKKGDMNRDEVLDIADVLALTNLILGIVPLTDNLLAHGDMNNDDGLTIADVTLLIGAAVRQPAIDVLNKKLKVIKDLYQLVVYDLSEKDPDHEQSKCWEMLEEIKTTIDELHDAIRTVTTDEQITDIQIMLASVSSQLYGLRELIASLSQP